MGSQRLSEAESEQKAIREKRRQYNRKALAERRQLTRERMKPLLAFMKEYYQEHYYFNSKGLARIYSNQEHGKAPPISLILAFGRILRDLKDLGAIEKHNSQVYRKVINPEEY